MERNMSKIKIKLKNDEEKKIFESLFNEAIKHRRMYDAKILRIRKSDPYKNETMEFQILRTALELYIQQMIIINVYPMNVKY